VSAVYDLEFRQVAGGSWVLSGEHPDDFGEAMAACQRLAGAWKGARLGDGWVTLHEWDATATTVPVRFEAPGHGTGCQCGECGCRAAHQRGEHHDHVCGHRVCRRCGDCEDCNQADDDESHGRYIAILVEQASERIALMLRELAKTGNAVRELTSSAVYDIELAESSDGADLKAALTDAGRSLRSARRIIEARKLLLGEAVPGGE